MRNCVLSLRRWSSILLVGSEQIKITSSLYSPYDAEACNEWRGPFLRLSAWATQLRRNVATVASRWRHCADLTCPGIETQTSRTDSERLATELTGRFGSEQMLVRKGLSFIVSLMQFKIYTVTLRSPNFFV